MEITNTKKFHNIYNIAPLSNAICSSLLNEVNIPVCEDFVSDIVFRKSIHVHTFI